MGTVHRLTGESVAPFDGAVAQPADSTQDYRIIDVPADSSNARFERPFNGIIWRVEQIHVGRRTILAFVHRLRKDGADSGARGATDYVAPSDLRNLADLLDDYEQPESARAQRVLAERIESTIHALLEE